MQDADTQSRLYDIVIASPAISSGLSIEHKDRPHFTLGVYIGAGTVTRPEDAKQQLGRVRYLNRFIIGLERSNLTGGLFDGINPQVPITPDKAEIIIDRIMVQPEAYAAVGIVGPKYRAQYRGTNGVFTVVKRPKKPNQKLKDILEKCGLKADIQRRRSVPNGALLLNKRGPSETAIERGYVLTVTPDSFTYMTDILVGRGTFDIDAALAKAGTSTA